MEQTLLSEVQKRLSQFKELKKEVDATQKQLDEKKQEIRDFYKEWKDKCSHVFYRVQELGIGITVTVGYHCCLCGEYQEAQYPLPALTPSHRRPRNYHRRPKNYIEERHLSKQVYPPKEPQADINAPNFIGTVVQSLYGTPEYPIPPEYQPQVDSKNKQLRMLQDEQSTLEEKLQSLKSSIQASEKELDNIAHLLNSYFRYPETVYETPHRWSPDDFNYDPFD